MDPIVIVGGGHAAAQLCGALAEGGYRGPVLLLSEEEYHPYHRPPLSKAAIKDVTHAPTQLRADSFYASSGIQVLLGTKAESVDRTRAVVVLRDAAGARHELPYGHLVLATGARARQLPELPAEAQGILTLRSFADADRLRRALPSASQVLIVGGGFIGLEVASSAIGLGCRVTLLEAAPRLLTRSVSPQVSGHLLEHHRSTGVDVRLGTQPDRYLIDQGRFAGVRIAGESVPADLLLVSIGAVPVVDLAEEAGLRCSNGICVDELLTTSDPRISAIGDCASFPFGPGGTRLRLESVQNAHDQARSLARRLLGNPEPYRTVPWFWSEQGSVRLQIAGLWSVESTPVMRVGAKVGSWSILHYIEGALQAVESVNAPLDHLAARKWLQAGHSPDPTAAADPAVPLKSL